MAEGPIILRDYSTQHNSHITRPQCDPPAAQRGVYTAAHMPDRALGVLSCHWLNIETLSHQSVAIFFNDYIRALRKKRRRTAGTPNRTNLYFARATHFMLSIWYSFIYQSCQRLTSPQSKDNTIIQDQRERRPSCGSFGHSRQASEALVLGRRGGPVLWALRPSSSEGGPARRAQTPEGRRRPCGPKNRIDTKQNTPSTRTLSDARASDARDSGSPIATQSRYNLPINSCKTCFVVYKWPARASTGPSRPSAWGRPQTTCLKGQGGG
eukprot:1178957-Prorocentrum_minimum.AAC.1